MVRRGWHVDIGFAAADLAPPLDQFRGEFPGARYLIFGFGDRRYLLRRGHDPAGALAALWPGPGLLLATGLAAPPEVAFGAAHVIRLPLRPSQARDAQTFVWQSLAPRDELRSSAPGPYPGSLFFDAAEPYHALNTCNTWVARVLAAAGLPVRAAGVVFAGQVWHQARRLESRRQQAAKITTP